MRHAVRVLALLALAPALVIGSSAFSADRVGARAVTASIVGDASAYLSLVETPGAPHRCFVEQDPVTGRLVLSFSTATDECHVDSNGQGLSGGDASGRHSRYSFHDILQLTNKGTKSANVWVNATTTSAGGSALHVARATSANSLTDASYFASSAAHVTLAPGSSLYLGVRVDSGSLVSTQRVEGSITVTGRASLGA